MAWAAAGIAAIIVVGIVVTVAATAAVGHETETQTGKHWEDESEGAAGGAFRSLFSSGTLAQAFTPQRVFTKRLSH